MVWRGCTAGGGNKKNLFEGVRQVAVWRQCSDNGEVGAGAKGGPRYSTSTWTGMACGPMATSHKSKPQRASLPATWCRAIRTSATSAPRISSNPQLPSGLCISRLLTPTSSPPRSHDLHPQPRQTRAVMQALSAPPHLHPRAPLHASRTSHPSLCVVGSCTML